MSEDSKVIDFRTTSAPSARTKKFDEPQKNPFCKHPRIEVWTREPIIECADCGRIVDPYDWIRDRCRDWEMAESAAAFKVSEAKAELEELKAALRILRAEYKDEAERRRAEHHLMVMPPRKRV